MGTRLQQRYTPSRRLSAGSVLVILVMVLMALPACEGPVQERRAPTPAPKTDKAADDEANFDDHQVVEYQRPDYRTRKRNPFQPDPDVFQPTQTVVTGDVRPVEPLEKFPLNSLELVAIISETAIPTAMFIDPDGFGHVIKEGDRMGRNNGVVTSIRDNTVSVSEGAAGEGLQGNVVSIRLRDLDLVVADEGLSEQDRQALERLLQSEHGREALQQSYRELDSGVDTNRRTSPPPAQDRRFPGASPPSRP